jgi:hypothetical protein
VLSGRVRTRSVKVPPMSTPRRTPDAMETA